MTIIIPFRGRYRTTLAEIDDTRQNGRYHFLRWPHISALAVMATLARRHRRPISIRRKRYRNVSATRGRLN